jgi:hypothetical protein
MRTCAVGEFCSSVAQLFSETAFGLPLGCRSYYRVLVDEGASETTCGNHGVVWCVFLTACVAMDMRDPHKVTRNQP